MLQAAKQKLWFWQRVVRSRLGIGSSMAAPDRRYQDQVLIPTALAAAPAGRLLYVGVSWYTYHLLRSAFRQRAVTTLDIAPQQAAFGARDHVVGGLESPALAGRAPFALVFLFGVLNYGINDRAAWRAALASLDRVMPHDGVCYLNAEAAVGAGHTVRFGATDMIETAAASGYAAAPVSGWFPVADGAARTRFYVIGRVGDRVRAAAARFPAAE